MAILKWNMSKSEGFMKRYLDLFLTMLKIGLFTFGGGYAMIALFESEFVERKRYLEKDEFLDMVAIAESTPGPIAINSATYIGYRQLGFFGALVATVGICVPSFVIIFLISLFFDAFLTVPLVANAFRGIQVAVVYLIFSAGIKMLKGMKKTALAVTITVATILTMVALSIFAVKLSTILYIVISGCVGIFAYLIARLSHKEEGEK